MKMKLIVLLILGVWTGMILGISFLEAPLKFQAPNITLILGLGIGKIVFTALNKVEMIFSVLLIGWLVFQFKNVNTPTLIILTSLIFLIVVQSFWLLPILNVRVDNLLSGIEVAKSNHHFYYVAFEISKVGLLILGFIKIYNHE